MAFKMERLISLIIAIGVSASAHAAQIRPVEMRWDHGSIVRNERVSPGFWFCDECPGRKSPIPDDKSVQPVSPPLRANLSMRFSEEGKAAQKQVGPPSFEKKNAGEKSPPPITAIHATSPPALPSPACSSLTVYFRFGKSSIERFERDQLEQMIPCLKNLREPVSVEGFTCRIGSRAVNDRLARDRAETVSKYLRERGIRVDGHAGRGRHGYIPPEDPLNRRVEIKIRQKGTEYE